ncbi:MAG: ankyrin repeat domain-containing protein [Candidatus Berkiellales bacterium]
MKMFWDLMSSAGISGKKSQLITEIENGHTEEALKLIEAGQDLETPDPDGKTPLHWAAIQGNERVCDALIKAKVNTNPLDSKSLVPINYARNYNNNIIIMLVNAGADLGKRGEMDLSALGRFTYEVPLFYQIMELPSVKGNPQKIENILCEDSDTIFFNIGHHCSYSGSVKEIDVLLRYPRMKEIAASFRSGDHAEESILNRLGGLALTKSQLEYKHKQLVMGLIGTRQDRIMEYMDELRFEPKSEQQKYEEVTARADEYEKQALAKGKRKMAAALATAELAERKEKTAALDRGAALDAALTQPTKPVLIAKTKRPRASSVEEKEPDAPAVETKSAAPAVAAKSATPSIVSKEVAPTTQPEEPVADEESKQPSKKRRLKK